MAVRWMGGRMGAEIVWLICDGRVRVGGFEVFEPMLLGSRALEVGC